MGAELFSSKVESPCFGYELWWWWRYEQVMSSIYLIPVLPMVEDMYETELTALVAIYAQSLLVGQANEGCLMPNEVDFDRHHQQPEVWEVPEIRMVESTEHAMTSTRTVLYLYNTV